MGISMEAQKEAILEKSKKTMSVPEMRRLLGLKKTDSYWLVHRNFFQTYIVNGQMRVDIASFEEWYEHQIMYQKVGRMPTITDLEKDYIRLQDAAALAGVTSGTITKWIQMGHFSSAGAGKALRIHRNEFLKWLKEYQEATQRRKKQKSEKKKLNINSLLEPLLSRNVPG